MQGHENYCSEVARLFAITAAAYPTLALANAAMINSTSASLEPACASLFANRRFTISSGAYRTTVAAVRMVSPPPATIRTALNVAALPAIIRAIVKMTMKRVSDQLWCRRYRHFRSITPLSESPRSAMRRSALRMGNDQAGDLSEAGRGQAVTVVGMRYRVRHAAISSAPSMSSTATSRISMPIIQSSGFGTLRRHAYNATVMWPQPTCCSSG
jgi:hypothetical protein